MAQNEVFPNSRIEKVWLWRHQKPPVPFRQIGEWLNLSRQRAHTLFRAGERWHAYHAAGAEVGSLGDLRLAQFVIDHGLETREKARPAIASGEFFPVRTKGLRMNDYIKICRWAGVEPHRPDIVEAWRKVKEAEELILKRKRELEHTEKRYG